MNWQTFIRATAIAAACAWPPGSWAQGGQDIPLSSITPLPATPQVSEQARALRATLLGPEAADPNYVTLHWVGVASFIVTIGQHLLLFDAWEVIGIHRDYVPIGREELAALEPEAILIGHGHFDHAADAGYIASRTSAVVVGSQEICDIARSDAEEVGGGRAFDCAITGTATEPAPGTLQSLKLFADLPPITVLQHIHSAATPPGEDNRPDPFVPVFDPLPYLTHLNDDPEELARFIASQRDPQGGTWMYQLRIRDFSLLLGDSAGPIFQSAPVREALGNFPECVDVMANAILGFDQPVSGLQDPRLYVEHVIPRVFLPSHGDAWAPVISAGQAQYEDELRAQLATLDAPPELDMLLDPQDYLRTRAYFVDDPIWKTPMPGSACAQGGAPPNDSSVQAGALPVLSLFGLALVLLGRRRAGRRHAATVALTTSALLLGACTDADIAQVQLGAINNCSTAFECRTVKSAPLAQRCEAPRAGADPDNDFRPYTDRQGSLRAEQNWLATYMSEVYLWADEIPRANPHQFTLANHATPAAAMSAYFEALLTPELDARNEPKDQFSFTADTDAWNARSRRGESVGYGFQAALLQAFPPREIRIAYTDPNSPASEAQITRGAQIIRIDGVDVANGQDTETLNAGLFPSTAGEQHRFEILDLGASSSREVVLTAQRSTTTPVPTVSVLSTQTGPVGYLLFNQHVATAEGALVNAVRQLRDTDITDLVLDLRYNGGGFLDIAAQLAYMIAGPERTHNRSFETLIFNAKNPLSALDTRTPFHAHSLGFDPALARGTPLPTLVLDRLFVLSGAGTCSASEALINGLQGVNFPVIQIGATSCGKPYGFFQQDNCGLSYFAIEFEGVNDLGIGGYAHGLAPDCAVDDDFGHALGDPDEARLAAALNYRSQGQCGTASKAAVTEHLKLLRDPSAEVGLRRPPNPS